MHKQGYVFLKVEAIGDMIILYVYCILGLRIFHKSDFKIKQQNFFNFKVSY